MGFFFKFVYMVDYIDRCSYVEPSLYLWDEIYLIMVDDISDVFLDSVCKYFIIFASMFMRKLGLSFSFLVASFVVWIPW